MSKLSDLFEKLLSIHSLIDPKKPACEKNSVRALSLRNQKTNKIEEVERLEVMCLCEDCSARRWKREILSEIDTEVRAIARQEAIENQLK